MISGLVYGFLVFSNGYYNSFFCFVWILDGVVGYKFEYFVCVVGGSKDLWDFYCGFIFLDFVFKYLVEICLFRGYFFWVFDCIFLV